MRRLLTCYLLLAIVGCPQGSAIAAEAAVVKKQPQAKLAPMVERGVAFLASAQDEDGSYSSFAGTGITSLITTAVLAKWPHTGDPLIARSLKYLQTQVKDDGGIYQKGSLYRNYETCLAILCFAEANREGRYDKLLERAEAFVKDLQWDGNEGHEPSSTSYGGAGYGKHNRPTCRIPIF